MGAPEQTLRGPELEVPAKATRRRFTLEYKRKIVREADGYRTPGAVGALPRGTVLLPPGDMACGARAGRSARGAEEAGAGASGHGLARQGHRRAGARDHAVEAPRRARRSAG
jgi:hypothetical protein